MKTKFQYSESDWADIRPFVASDLQASVRRALQVAGSRYLLSAADPGPTQSADRRKIVEGRGRIAKRAQALLDALELVDIGPIDLGLGRDAALIGLDEALSRAIIKRAAVEELAVFRRSLRVMIEWSGADQMSFFPKNSSAHKPAKTWLVAKCLSIWKGQLGHNVPAGGGSADGKMSRFVRVSCNPILGELKDGISDGEAAKKLIKAAISSHADMLAPKGEN
ncbi:hypothetical protein JQ615_18130 [Bradyrhizobium jicamae]|uniref:Uncharacterized protein n=1 Tax=Bradyrhizobium jicamae TaxID=280332 RepID=A0ABS5FKK2_9BRAD|nr:hypothetical protein [Bradyrhizobium jicamae]MBR0797310.1 hypothetical protein [Bradyrhizobium jicamae]